MKIDFIVMFFFVRVCNESIAQQRSADGTYYMSGNPELVGNYVDEQGNIMGTTTPTFGGKKTKAPKGGKSVGKKTKGYKGGKSGKGKKGTTKPTSSPTKKPTSSPTKKKLFPIFFPKIPKSFPDIAEPANDRAFIFPTNGALSNSLD